MLVEIAFQICTSYRPDLPEHRLLTGWFPCVTSGNSPQDERSKQLKGSLEREDEVWLKVSGPNGFLCRLWIGCACINDALEWLVRRFPFIISKFLRFEFIFISL